MTAKTVSGNRKVWNIRNPFGLYRDHDNYNTLYDSEIEDGAAEEIEEFTGTDINGKSRGFVRSDASEQYEAELDDEGIESPLGDIPYHEKDSYIEDEKK